MELKTIVLYGNEYKILAETELKDWSPVGSGAISGRKWRLISRDITCKVKHLNYLVDSVQDGNGNELLNISENVRTPSLNYVIPRIINEIFGLHNLDNNWNKHKLCCLASFDNIGEAFGCSDSQTRVDPDLVVTARIYNLAFWYEDLKKWCLYFVE